MSRVPSAVAAFVEAESHARSWPGGSWWVEEGGRIAWAGAAGLLSIVPERLPADPGAIYDLASLTKPLATAALLVQLEQEGAMDLEAPVRAALPEWPRRGRDEGPTLLDLALHRSGLPAWRPFYARSEGREAILERIMRLEPEYVRGSKVVYSDPGYILLGEAIRRVAGRDLDELFRDRIAGPLGLDTIGFRPPPAWKPRIAPTEVGNQYELEKALRLGEDPDPGRFRKSLIHGEVHDGNAHALRGAAGHAGLFGAAEEVARLAREFLGTGTGLFGDKALRLFRENLTPGLEEGRTLGWKRALGASEAQGALPDEAFGHTGFTGTSVWLDPLSDRIYVLLTNRVHPEVRDIDMNGLRKRFHQIASRLFS